MSEQKAAYSPAFQHFRQLVETALVQAAADARELAERTGTELVIRERPEPESGGQGDVTVNKVRDRRNGRGTTTEERCSRGFL